FTTSTLQQDASRKLGFSAKKTMQVAQRLYEGVDIGGETVGLITYMRTDGVQIVPEAVATIRNQVSADYGARYTPGAPRIYKSKAKNAQEAHEAIRPTDIIRRPKDMSRILETDQARLYELIWQRTVASQMASAEIAQTRADISVAGRDGKNYTVRATGSVVVFDGFLKAYDEGRDERQKAAKGKDDLSDADDASRRLPALKEGDALNDNGIDTNQHFTQPPPRFTEATLVKRMEELGIGRPSTYASTLAVLQDRDYMRTDRKRLIPEDKGRLVIAFLESFFQRYVEFDFTANLEQQLDISSDGSLEWKDVLRDFWRDFTAAIGEIKDLRVSEVLDALNEMLGPHIFPPREGVEDPRKCPSCDSGRLSLKISGKYGAFIGCENYPDCNYTRQLASDSGGDPALAEGKELGVDPETGLPVTLRTGRFGPYVQLGEGSKDEKPKRSSIPNGIDAGSVDFDYALKLLSLPRDVGAHPEDGKMITAGLGRYGPFVLHDGTYANVENIEEVFSVGINRAVTLIAEKKAGKGRRFGRAAAKKVIKELGEHPTEGGKIEVLDGRYGPYVTHNKINATVPKSSDPASLSVDEAVHLLAERAAKVKAKKPAKKATKKKAPAKKKAASKSKAKSAAKKAPTKKAKAKAKTTAKSKAVKAKTAT
nr:topoisomerase DNA-binding C4 zinc finger domain-containing protein [Alphaproteobacteria bacterium]